MHVTNHDLLTRTGRPKRTKPDRGAAAFAQLVGLRFVSAKTRKCALDSKDDGAKAEGANAP